MEDSIGYVHMGSVENSDVDDMMEQLMQTKAIVFDIRNYPRGTMYNIANYLSDSSIAFAKFTVPDLSYPGKFVWTKPLYCGKKNGKEYNGKVILLVNEYTQSHAEFTTMSLQTAQNVMIVGSQTSGADGNVTRLELVGGHPTMISGIGVFYPDGRETQRIGMVPDVKIRPTIKGMQEGKDEVLEKAIEIIHQ